MTPEWQRFQELQNTRSDCFFVMDAREPERPVLPGLVNIALIIGLAVAAVVTKLAGGW